MGDTLNDQMLAAFADELELLEKEAGLAGSAGKWMLGKAQWAKKGLLGGKGEGFREMGKRMMSPIKSTKEQWKKMAPGTIPKTLRHAYGDIVVTRTAKRLGQSGWTGQGKITKYMPVGQKGMMAGMGAMSVPSVIEAAKKKPTATGEGGIGEVGLREALGLGGMIAGTGLGMLPAIGLYGAGSYLGGKAGRVIDRLRGGADVSTAVNAPSRTEAQNQLANIQRYYG